MKVGIISRESLIRFFIVSLIVSKFACSHDSLLFSVMLFNGLKKMPGSMPNRSSWISSTSIEVQLTDCRSSRVTVSEGVANHRVSFSPPLENVARDGGSLEDDVPKSI